MVDIEKGVLDVFLWLVLGWSDLVKDKKKGYSHVPSLVSLSPLQIVQVTSELCHIDGLFPVDTRFWQSTHR